MAREEVSELGKRRGGEALIVGLQLSSISEQPYWSRKFFFGAKETPAPKNELALS